MIRFSPERRDLKRVRELLDRNAVQQQLSTQFKCDVSIEDRKAEGAERSSGLLKQRGFDSFRAHQLTILIGDI